MPEEKICFYCGEEGEVRRNFGYKPIYLCKECYERKKQEWEAESINLMSR